MTVPVVDDPSSSSEEEEDDSLSDVSASLKQRVRDRSDDAGEAGSSTVGLLGASMGILLAGSTGTLRLTTGG